MTFSLIALAFSPQTEPPPIVEYLRINDDGSETEQILVYRPAPERVEVVKLRDRCTSAAWVTGVVDRTTGTTMSLEAGRLLPDAKRQVVGTLTHGDNPARIDLALGQGNNAITRTVPVAPGPWHDYDFDLASLSAVLDGGPPPVAPIRFALPMVWNGKGELLQNLGVVTLTFEREEDFAGHAAMRYRATSSSRHFKGGPIWLDRDQGIVLGARWGTPNHNEYANFSLTAMALHVGGAASWDMMLRAHWANCPPE